MSKAKKSPFEKFETKIKRAIEEDKSLTVVHKTIVLKDKNILSYTSKSVKYNVYRYFPSKKEDLTIENFPSVVGLVTNNFFIIFKRAIL